MMRAARSDLEALQALGWEQRRRPGGTRGYFDAQREQQPGEEG